MDPTIKISLNLLDLLTHPKVLVRVLISWLLSLIIFFGVWTVSYLWLAPGSLHFGASNLIPSTAGEAVLPEALNLFTWNLLIAAVPVALTSLFVIGRLPAGYLMTWVICACYGAMLGTNSFAFPDPAGPSAPNFAVLWTRAGLREITAYLFIASALADIYLWRQASWWSVKVKQVRSFKELRLLPGEVVCLVIAVGFLGWAAYVEAWQIIHL